MKYAISVLQKAAIELAGEILHHELLKQQVVTSDEVAKMAHQLLFGGFTGKAEKETGENYLELVEAIKILTQQEAL